MAVMAPEAVDAAGGAAASAAGGLFGKGRTPVVDRGEGSSAAFMISIFLITGAMICAWVAFHKQDSLNPDQFPGLFRMIIQWVQEQEDAPGVLTPTSSDVSTPAGAAQSAISDITKAQQLVGPLPVPGLNALVNAAVSKIKNALHI